MTTIVTGIRLQVEGAGSSVGQLKEVRAAVVAVAEGEREAAASSDQLSAASAKVAASVSVVATEMGHAATASGQLSSAAASAGALTGNAAAEIIHAASASGQLSVAASEAAASVSNAANEIVHATTVSGQLFNATNEAAASVNTVANEMVVAAAASGQLSEGNIKVASAAGVAAGELVRAASAANETSASLARTTGATDQYATMAAQLRSELDPMFAVQQRYDQELERANLLLKGGELGEREFADAVKLANDNLRAGAAAIFQTGSAQDQLNSKLGLQRAGWQGIGFQLQDVLASYSSGIALTTIFAQQSGQFASAIAMIAESSEGAGGGLEDFASLLSGPWGIALGVAVSLIGALAAAYFEAEEEAEGLTATSLTLTDALQKTRFATDEARKALEDYNAEQDRARKGAAAMIAVNLALAEASIKAALATRAQTIAELSGYTTRILNPGPLGPGPDEGLGLAISGAIVEKKLEEANRDVASLGQTLKNLRIEDATRSAKAAVDPIVGINNKFDDMAAAATNAAAGNYALSRSLKGTLTDIEKRRAADIKAAQATGRTPRAQRGPASDTTRRAEYGEDIAKKIAGISDQFSDLPSAVSRANKAMLELDDISSDLSSRPLTPNVIALKDEIARVRAVVNESLTRPFEDYLEASREAAEIDKLLLQGKDDEAAALQVIIGLKQKMGPLDRDQINAVLATVRAQREMDMVLRDQRALISANVAAVQDFRGALEGTVADALRGKFSIERVLSSIGNSYVNIVSQKLVEGMFGDTLRQLEAQASGADKVDAAGTRIASSLDTGATAVENFADTINDAIAKIERAGATGDTSGGAGPTNLLDQIVSAMTQQSTGDVSEASDDEIVVTANKSKKVDLSGTGAMLLDMVDATLRRIGIALPNAVTEGLKGPLAKLEQSLPQALQGAFTGSAASKLILGNGGSGVGGALGGAIGQKMGEKFLSSGFEKVGGKLLGSLAGPLGGILGGVVGGLLGSAFKKTTTGYAVASNTGVSSGGSNKQLAANAQASGDSIQGALSSIADRLGATIGDYAVSIGMRSSGWVSVSGSGSSQVADNRWKKRNVGGDLLYDGKDPEQALKVAIQNAIQDGAIEGVSAAVKKALGSSSDIDTALREALKVADVELLLGGIGAQFQKSFREFENQAKERLRVAREYGFDLVKLEAQNAKDRLKLSEQLLKDQVGGLQDLIREMTSGSLFEGSAVDRRDKLLTEIATAKSKVDAGEEGAADTLAQLLQQFNEVSKEVYGTTGGFASDRQTILDAANDSVAKAKAQIAAAQAATDPAVVEALDENNDQNAAMLSELGLNNEYLREILAGLSGRGGAAGLAALARTS